MPFYSNLSPGLSRRMQYSDYIRYRSYRRYIRDYRRLQSQEHVNTNTSLNNEISFKNLYNDTKVRINDLEIFCSICQSDIQVKTEIVRELKCCHIYHLHCIDTWFLIKNECPLCKKKI